MRGAWDAHLPDRWVDTVMHAAAAASRSDDRCPAGLSAGEFVAHSGAVNCVRIGRSTAGVLATGGEDKKVNLWRTGQTEVVKVGKGNLCRLTGTAPHPARNSLPASRVAPAKSNPTPGW